MRLLHKWVLEGMNYVAVQLSSFKKKGLLKASWGLSDARPRTQRPKEDLGDCGTSRTLSSGVWSRMG